VVFGVGDVGEADGFGFGDDAVGEVTGAVAQSRYVQPRRERPYALDLGVVCETLVKTDPRHLGHVFHPGTEQVI
jgi:hypothetical protein